MTLISHPRKRVTIYTTTDTEDTMEMSSSKAHDPAIPNMSPKALPKALINSTNVGEPIIPAKKDVI